MSLLRIHHIGICHLHEYFFKELACFPSCHRQVVEQVIATVAWSGSGDFSFKVGDEAEGALHERHDVLGLEVAAEQEIVARQAAHRSPVDHAVLPLLVVSEEGGGEIGRASCRERV